MTIYEELKSKQKAALIVVFTLGLAAVPIALNWNSNIFEGTSFDNEVPPQKKVRRIIKYGLFKHYYKEFCTVQGSFLLNAF